jgi:hypothetical protein
MAKSLTFYLEVPMHHRASSIINGGIMTAFHFIALVTGTIFVWLYPNVSGMLFLVVLSRLIWKWTS